MTDRPASVDPTLGCLLLMAIAGLGLACSDPEFPPEPAEPGSSGKADDPGSPTAPKPGSDGGLPSQPAPQCKTQGWTCNQIGTCASACGIDLGCVNACKSKGCPAAQAAFSKSMECIQASCLGDCMGGMSKGCGDCVAVKCPAQGKACDTNTCPQVCTTPPPASDGGAPPPNALDGAAAPSPTPTQPTPPAQPTTPQACASIFECLKGCFMRLGPCLSDCRSQGCPASIAAFDALSACADQQCPVDCLFPLVPVCTGCLLQKCGSSWQSCASTPC